jgi:hypothetical protein
MNANVVNGQQIQLVCTPTFNESSVPLNNTYMGNMQPCTLGMKAGGNVSLVCEPVFTQTEYPLFSNQSQSQTLVSCSLQGYEGGGSVDYDPEIVGENSQHLSAYAQNLPQPHIVRTGPMPFMRTQEYAEGGDVHQPEFYSEGGLNNTYVTGKGDGTSDSIPAMLANGEFVIPADVVSSLGNGSNDSGAKVLDEFLKTIRHHKRDVNPNKLPPDSKGPLGYLLEAKKKVK